MLGWLKCSIASMQKHFLEGHTQKLSKFCFHMQHMSTVKVCTKGASKTSAPYLTSFCGLRRYRHGFITNLPAYHGQLATMVVIAMFSKATLGDYLKIFSLSSCGALHFYDTKLHGYPKGIISDHNPIFINFGHHYFIYTEPNWGWVQHITHNQMVK